MADTTLPALSNTVDQAVFIEPLFGASHPRNFLDRFPEEVYNTSPDAHLVKFLYSLLGPSGIGWLKKNYLDARLWFASHGFDLDLLERYYGDPFTFGRILSEIYTEDPAGLLNKAQWDIIKAKDESYRSRAIDYLNGARLGTTPEGMRLVARSGLGYDTRIIENYRYLFDAHSDDPIGLPFYGKTSSLVEFIVVPHQAISRSAVQTLTIGGAPSGGFYVLVFNGHQTTNYKYAAATFLSANVALPSGTISANTGGFLNAGSFSLGGQTITYTGRTSNSFTGCTGGVGTITAGTTIQAPPTTYNNIPWDATPSQVEAALRSLSNIGPNGVKVEGTNTTLTIQFGGPLANSPVPDIQVINQLSGGISPGINVSTTVGGIEAVDEAVTANPSDLHHLEVGLDFTRPVQSITSYNVGSGSRSRQTWATTMASSVNHSVIRYVTGNPGVNWPPVDSVHWIEPSNEIEAPRVHNDIQHHYVGFHNVGAVVAYTDAALADPAYASDEGVLSLYNSEYIGQFDPAVQRALPYLAQFGDNTHVFYATAALADYPEPLTVSTQDNTTGISLINGIYPVDYSNLQGVPQILHRDHFWASTARVSGDDYLEIDLGTAKAVNFITFEALQLPLDIEIAYDVSDQSPARRFLPVTPLASLTFSTSLDYQATDQNPWVYLSYNFTNGIGNMIFTRFIRIKFSRRVPSLLPDAGVAPFLYNPLTHTQTPWNIGIRNLRFGRNVSNDE